ncbi:MAG: urea amidolyase associated protein UAAP1 [Granulosicoccus sp.]
MNASHTVHYTTQLSAGKHVSFRLRRGLALSLTDEHGGANVGMVLYNAENLLERYNTPDTLKCQHTFHLTQGHCLYSDMGRILASVTHDSHGAHESICGNSNAQQVTDQFGPRDYQNARNDWHQNGQDAFLVELVKYGLDHADLPSNINWFSQCNIGDDGSISLDQNRSTKGSSLTLRIEMDCLVLLHTCPHPMSSASTYPDTPVSLVLSDAPVMTEDDICLNSCDENRRGFENNRLYHLGKR